MAVYKRKDSAYWWIEFSRGGTRYRFSAETTSRKEALKVERDAKRDIEQQLKSGRRTMRLSEVAKAYYDLRRLGHGKDASAKHDAVKTSRRIAAPFGAAYLLILSFCRLNIKLPNITLAAIIGE